MKATAVSGALLILASTPAFAHRVDELLQATTISLERGRVQVDLRLTPGIAIVPTLLKKIDTSVDGVLSIAEQRTYAEAVIRDLSLELDGRRLPLRLVSWDYPAIALMKAGRGDIMLQLSADVPVRDGNRRLVFKNRHQKRIAEYLANALVPSDPTIHITAQQRNYVQSTYRLDFVTSPEAGRLQCARSIC